MTASSSTGTGTGEDVAASLRDAAELSVLGRDRPALALLHRLAAAHPDDAAVRCHLALALLHKGSPQAALREADAAVALSGQEAQAHHVRGAALLRCGRAGEACTALRHALDLAPTDTGVLVELAAAECAAGDRSGALAHAETAARLRPRDPRAESTLALALLAAGRWSDAEAAARRALETARGDVPASNNLGLALAAQHKLPEARRFLREARVHSESMKSTHDVVARNQRLLGAGDGYRGGLRTAALNHQLSGVVFFILFPLVAFARGPWLVPVLVIAAALALRPLVFRALGGGPARKPELVALPATARVTVPPPKKR